MQLINNDMKKYSVLNWWKITLVIIIVIIINKSVSHILPDINEEKLTMSWFAAKIPYASIRLLFTFLLAYIFIEFKNIKGWNKFKWWFIIFIPILYYLVRPEIIDYSEFKLSTTILASTAMLIGVIQEELFSRGILYTHIKKKTNGFLAILFSSLIFGLLHHSYTGVDAFSIETIISNAIGPFIIGLVLGTVYHFYKSLPLVIILHFIWNIVNMIWITGMQN